MAFHIDERLIAVLALTLPIGMDGGRHLMNLNLRTLFPFWKLISSGGYRNNNPPDEYFLGAHQIPIQQQIASTSYPEKTYEVRWLIIKYHLYESDFRDLWTIRRRLLRAFLIEMTSIQGLILEQAREYSQKYHHMFQNVSHHVVRPRHLSQAPQQYVIQVCSSLFVVLSKHRPFWDISIEISRLSYNNVNFTDFEPIEDINNNLLVLPERQMIMNISITSLMFKRLKNHMVPWKS